MTALLLAVCLILAGGASAILLGRHPVLADRVYAVLVVSGCAAGLLPAFGVLAGGPTLLVVALGSIPGGAWSFGIDLLSAWFLLVVLAVGACAAVFGIGYLAPERGHRAVGGAHALFTLLLAALVGVVTAQAMLPFLAAWEVMALSAYLLVMFEHEQGAVRRAGLVYILLTHLSTLALIAMFAAFGGTVAGRSFAELAPSMSAPGAARTFGLGFALLGFGLKAGAVPLHFWLPGAHAAAPSHVSAVLSGVMLKMGIYGLLRVLSLAGHPPAWFGWMLFGLGLSSGVLGVLWALGQHDLKRLLAYHSVENIGIILLGMGVGALGQAYGHPVVAVLGYTGALLHTLNHALFKSLLFLGAGAVLRATGTRMLDALGGLARVMPWTSVAFGVGAVAIVGLPPLNGFVSEWIVFQGMLTAGAAGDGLRFVVAGTAGLALIGGLALACFTKVTGVVFLGSPRSAPGHRSITCDPGAGMLTPMLLLASVCVVIGLAPGLVLGPAHAVAVNIVPSAAVGGILPVEWGDAASWISALGAGLIVAGAGVLALRRALAGPHRHAPTWACASALPAPRAQYSASSYAAPLLTTFGPLGSVQRTESRTAFHTHPVDLVQDVVVLPVSRALARVSDRARELQGGRLRWYLFSVVFTLLALLYYLTNARPTL